MKFLDFKNIFVYDIEVFEHYWSVAIKSHHTGKRVFFQQASDDELQGTEGQRLKEFLDTHNPMLVGFNNTGYDNHILNVMINGYNNREIKELNDYIIGEGEQAWTWEKYPKRSYFPYDFTDLMDDLQERMSLKMYEANKGMNISESSVPFTLNRPLTQAEKDENYQYNMFGDVDATESLMLDRMTYLNTKIELGQHAGLSAEKSVSMTNAKLVASYLVGNKKPKTDWKDTHNYQIPENIRVNDESIIDYFINILDTTPKYDTIVAGVSHTYAQGGIHGGEDSEVHSSDDIWQVQLADGDQFYPSIIVNYKYQSRAMDRPELYDDSVKQRGIYKAMKDPRQEPFKLTNNTAYGATNNKYNALNDPLMANSTCFTGQLLLTDLIERLSEGLGEDYRHIQSNTDGIMYKYKKSRQADVDRITKEWEERAMIKLDFENINTITQSNVNNYIMLNDDGYITAKGAQLKAYHGRTWMDGHLQIVAKAMGDFFLYGINPEKTIKSATDILDFQMLLRNGRTYDYGIAETPHGEVPIQRVNRVYASKDKRYGMLYKCKNDGKRDKMPSCPPHSIVDNENNLTLDDIDLQFYINLANERILKILGGKDMSELGKLADRITRLEMDGQLLEVKKGDYIPKEWTDANVISLKRYKELLETQEETEMKVNIEEVVQDTITDEELDQRIKDLKEEVKPKAKASMGDQGVAIHIETDVTVGKNNQLALLGKIHALRKMIQNHRWVEDGYNKNQKYGFISAGEVKKVTNPMLIELGLELEPVLTDIEWIQNPGSSMHITQAQGYVKLIDIETGEEKQYDSFVQGADGGDKGVYKARTGLVKYFWFDVFNIATMDDAEYDTYTEVSKTADMTEPKTGWTSPEERQAIKGTVAEDTQPAREQNVAVLRDLYSANANTIIPSEIELLGRIATTMRSSPTDTQVVNLIMEAESVFGI